MKAKAKPSFKPDRSPGRPLTVRQVCVAHGLSDKQIAQVEAVVKREGLARREFATAWKVVQLLASRMHG